MAQALALKYRPKNFSDLTEQKSVVEILTNQINTNTIKHGYLFCGGAGTGKTTSARIFASMINKGSGEPIELDAASNNSVEDIRRITEEAQTKSLDSEYKVFIVDECFPGNTFINTEVGSVFIKDIVPGTRVKSMTGLNTVTHVFKHSVLTSRLCCVTINNKKLITTVDHLFFTNNGWVKAVDLCKGDIVYGTADLQKLWKNIPGTSREELYSEILLPSMLGNISNKESAEKNKSCILSSLWEADDCTELFPQKNLLNTLQECTNIEVRKSDYEYRIWDDATETIIRKDVEIKSISQSRNCEKIFKNERAERYTSSMEGSARWEREVHNSTDSLVRSIRNWMGVGVSNTNGLQSKNEKRSISYMLQSRPRLSTNESCNRGGWCRAYLEKWIIERCKESSIAGNFRVESVEVYKRGYNDELFQNSFSSEQLSKNYVELYDLEVENDHSYFANDILVHNCHMLSNSAWNAFLKTLEEPPAKSIFILCTTNPEKIPATILSRVQRYNFQRISMQGVIDRLLYILEREDSETDVPGLDWDIHAVDLIAKIADGGMRDAITLLDKCLSYSNDLTVPNVINALGLVSYDTMFKLTAFLINKDVSGTIKLITSVFESGMDLKQFIKDYFEFILDLNIYYQTGNMDSIKIPIHCEPTIKEFKNDWGVINSLLQVIVDLMNEIKWIQNPKSVILARLMLFNKGA